MRHYAHYFDVSGAYLVSASIAEPTILDPSVDAAYSAAHSAARVELLDAGRLPRGHVWAHWGWWNSTRVYVAQPAELPEGWRPDRAVRVQPEQPR